MFTRMPLRQLFRRIAFAMISLEVILMSIAACAPHAIPITASLTSFQAQSFSKTNTPSITTTPKPTASLTLTSTLDSITLAASEFDVPRVCLFTYLVSIDRNWIGADCKIYRELIIGEKSSGNKIRIPYQDLDKENPSNLSTLPLGWSGDSKYFYFTTRCCDYVDSSNSNGPLYQFDTQKQTWSIVVYALYEPFYFFSGDGKRYVYLNHHSLDGQVNPRKLDIGIVGIDKNDSKVFTLEGYWGPLYDEPTYAWSKDSERFAIVLYRPSFHPHEVSLESVLFRVDFKKMSMEIIEKFN